MGIPSYYKRLIKQIEGFYCSRPDHVDRLLMDYNCLIYQVFREFSSSSEPEFIDEICKYTKTVIDLTDVEQKNVYIAMDGIVPLAKMRQQRMRRFRAAATANPGSWDTNAITPGTNFMIQLSAALKSAFPLATISDTSEFGEGEHKLMNYIRKNVKTAPASRGALQVSSAHAKTEENLVIYGLDGDLFVLGILNQSLFVPHAKIFFLREDQQSNCCSKPGRSSGEDQAQDQVFVWHSLQALSYGLLREKSDVLTAGDWLKEYSLAMSLLGNDFVPTGLSFRIREGGHERLLSYLRRLHESGLRLLNDDGLSADGWSQLFKWLADEEERFITKAIQQKGNAASKVATNDELPLKTFNENDGALLNDYQTLRPNWHSLYARKGLEAPESLEIHYLTDSAKQYINALQWIYNYYCDAGPVSFDWMYPYSIAPLFGSVSSIFNGFDTSALNNVTIKPTVFEQLAIVLPPKSWHLIPKCNERNLLVRAPHLFPKGELKYYTFGKRFTWECEPLIPIPTISEVRSLLQ